MCGLDECTELAMAVLTTYKCWHLCAELGLLWLQHQHILMKN